MFDFLIFIGRFQPFHVEHLRVLKQALAQSARVIVLVGSARQARNPRNPFTFNERQSMILQSLTADEAARVDCWPLEDCLYNDALWIQTVQAAVQAVLNQHTASLLVRIGLIGYSKDQSSYYLQLFPQWARVEVKQTRALSATPLRNAYLLGQPLDTDLLPQGTQHFLAAFSCTEHYQKLQNEAILIAEHQQAWSFAPYPVIFVTVDAVVIQAEHILLIERKATLGQGLWALAGGFVEQQETLIQACLRELREETSLNLPDAVLHSALKAQQVFDDPHRSARGRMISHAFMFELTAEHGLPKVKGGDDAESAFWLPLAQLQPELLFDDHFHIIKAMTKKL